MTIETGWAIKGKFGFYYGRFSRTRIDAIVNHVMALETYPYWPTAAKLKLYWQRRYRAGDRAVKVQLVEIERRGAVR